MSEVEIFMPFYGDIGQFKEAVYSVLRQRDPIWKLTVIDDQYGSPEPRNFIETLNDGRITFLENAVNLGVSRNFQKCVDLAQADYMTVMGCDDVLLPDYVGHMKEIIHTNPGVAFIQPGVDVIDEAGETYLPLGDVIKSKLRKSLKENSLHSGQPVFSSLLLGCWTYFPSICWKSSFLKAITFRSDYSIVLDLAMQLEILAAGGSLYLDNLIVFQYRRHRNSVSMVGAADGQRFLEESKLFTEYSLWAKSRSWSKARRAARLHITSRMNAILFAAKALRSGNYNLFGVLMKHALWVSP